MDNESRATDKPFRSGALIRGWANIVDIDIRNESTHDVEVRASEMESCGKIIDKLTERLFRHPN